MNCQKCSTGHAVEPTTSTSRTPFPQDRKDLYDKVSQDASSPTFKRVIPPARHGIGSQPAMAASTKAGLKDNPAMSFVMLTDSQVVSPQATGKSNNKSQSRSNSRKPNGTAEEGPDGEKPRLSQQIESTTRLFEILSARSDIDHPICTECTDLLLSQLQSRLSSAMKERDTYISFLKSLNTSTPTSTDLTKAQRSLAEACGADAKAFSELLALEKEKAALDAEITSLEAESLALDAEEQDFWRSRNSFTLTLSEFQNERDALNAAYDHDAQQLERLQRTNVYNDCFCISHDGHFGTINGLRLGRLPPPQNVEWPEINAALGTAALLLATVAQKLDVEFQGMRIKPMGSTSRIEKFEYAGSQSSSTATITPNATARSSKDVSPSQSATTGGGRQQRQQQQQPKPSTSLDLFSSGDLPLVANRIMHRRLDAGLVAFLDCIRQLGEYVEMTSAEHQQQTLPYVIEGDKIHGVSIKLGGNHDHEWTRACKYTLTCCKFLLAHASNVGSVRAREGG
ncbi:MAG: hypothetical protein Q9226_003683 [Calogaya cf. arnoldii]